MLEHLGAIISGLMFVFALVCGTLILVSLSNAKSGTDPKPYKDPDFKPQAIISQTDGELEILIPSIKDLFVVFLKVLMMVIWVSVGVFLITHLPLKDFKFDAYSICFWGACLIIWIGFILLMSYQWIYDYFSEQTIKVHSDFLIQKRTFFGFKKELQIPINSIKDIKTYCTGGWRGSRFSLQLDCEDCVYLFDTILNNSELTDIIDLISKKIPNIRKPETKIIAPEEVGTVMIQYLKDSFKDNRRKIYG